jgi:hypothetical protein
MDADEKIKVGATLCGCPKVRRNGSPVANPREQLLGDTRQKRAGAGRGDRKERRV